MEETLIDLGFSQEDVNKFKQQAAAEGVSEEHLLGQLISEAIAGPRGVAATEEGEDEVLVAIPRSTWEWVAQRADRKRVDINTVVVEALGLYIRQASVSSV